MPETKEKPVTKTQVKPTLDVPCTFGGFSLPGDTGTLGVKIDRGELNVMSADAFFSGNQLTCRLLQGPADPQQKTFADMEVNHEVAGVFVVGGFRTTSECYSFTLKFQASGTPLDELKDFRKKTGRLVVQQVQPLEGAHDDDDEWDEDDDDLEADDGDEE